MGHRTDALVRTDHASHVLRTKARPDRASVSTRRRATTILVADDVEETRDGIARLLEADGYRVDPARNETDAVERARRQRPNLILVSLGGPEAEVVASARRIRQAARLSDAVPVVIFCIATVDAGAEVPLGRNVHVTRPDNFDQLRRLLDRLLYGSSAAG